jgi:putative transposase
MPSYRRNYVPGGTYFFTVVTHRRIPILTTLLGRDCFRAAIGAEQSVRPFEAFADVLLPDHLHAVWVLPQDDQDYSTRWRRIKERFTEGYLAGGGQEATRSASRARRSERGVWQRRFWEHTVRDEDDLKRCVDYIHWNPVKHGLVKQVKDYPWSSFHRFVESGDYDPDWGSVPPEDVPGAEWE